MTLNITLNMDNAAFDPTNGYEVACILNALGKELAYKELDPSDSGSLRDSNGNKVGTWEVID